MASIDAEADAGSTALTNTLAKKLPAEFIAQLPGGVASAYSAIPSIGALYVSLHCLSLYSISLTLWDSAEPLQTQVRTAFAESTRVIWLVLIPFGGVGLLFAVFMRQIKLETVTDEVSAAFLCSATRH